MCVIYYSKMTEKRMMCCKSKKRVRCSKEFYVDHTKNPGVKSLNFLKRIFASAC